MLYILLDKGSVVLKRNCGYLQEGTYLIINPDNELKVVSDRVQEKFGQIVFEKCVEFVNDNVIVYEANPSWVRSLKNVSRKSRLYTTLASAGILSGTKQPVHEDVILTDTEAVQIMARFYDDDS